MCGESWLATKPTAPVLKAGHPGVPCYICLFVYVMVGWVTFLFFLIFICKCAKHMYFHVCKVTHTHTHTYAHAHAHTHVHTHTWPAGEPVLLATIPVCIA